MQRKFKSNMKIQFQLRGLNDNVELRRWLRQSLERLEAFVPISDAAVVVERERNGAPAFRSFALLAVPGPDIHSEARDHTLEAVWLKVIASLRKQIDRRKFRQDARLKWNGYVRGRATWRPGCGCRQGITSAPKE